MAVAEHVAKSFVIQLRHAHRLSIRELEALRLLADSRFSGVRVHTLLGTELVVFRIKSPSTARRGKSETQSAYLVSGPSRR